MGNLKTKLWPMRLPWACDPPAQGSIHPVSHGEASQRNPQSGWEASSEVAQIQRLSEQVEKVKEETSSKDEQYWALQAKLQQLELESSRRERL